MTTIHSTPGRRLARLAAVAAAGITVGIGGALVVDAAPDAPLIEQCPPTEADLLIAAEAARRLELIHPAAFDVSPGRADYHDLRLAAEWARRIALMAPHTIPDHCHS